MIYGTTFFRYLAPEYGRSCSIESATRLESHPETRLDSTRLARKPFFSRISRSIVVFPLAHAARYARGSRFPFVRRAVCRETGNNGVRGEIKTAYGLFIFRRRATATTAVAVATTTTTSESLLRGSLALNYPEAFRFISARRINRAPGGCRELYTRYMRCVARHFFLRAGSFEIFGMTSSRR